MTFVDYGNPRPFYPPRTIPIPEDAPLNDQERQIIRRLQERYDYYMPAIYRYNAYYMGEQVVGNLGISVPPELAVLRTLTGWCRVPVDPLVDRLSVDGFRFPKQTEADPDLEAAWLDSACDAHQSIGYTEALVTGRGYVVVSPAVEPGGLPRITFDSPLSLIASYDPRTMFCQAAVQSYWEGDMRRSTFMLPDVIVETALGQDSADTWEVVSVTRHGWGRVPVHRMANSPRANERDGVSEITPELMSVTDAACRTLQSLEVAGQFYSVPQKVILGALEKDFVDPSGNPRSGWDTYLSGILALERDEDGELPKIAQFKAYDPAVYVKVIELYASIAAGICGAPAQDFGLYTKGNPTSAEAAEVEENRRDRKALRKQSMFSAGLRGGMQDVLRFMNNGVLPASARRIDVDWVDPKLYGILHISEAMAKQADAGIVPAQSGVIWSKLGYSQVQQERLRIDAEHDKAMQFLEETAHNVMAGVTRDMKIIGQGASGKAMGDEIVPALTQKSIQEGGDDGGNADGDTAKPKRKRAAATE